MVPPYSSTTIAMCLRDTCISRSRSAMGFESGMKLIGRISSETHFGSSPSASVARIMSLRFTTPSTSSTLSPITGTRV